MSAITSSAAPQVQAPGVPLNRGKDVLSGFLVFLIALPLCIGISIASGCPAFAGVLTAIVGSLVCAAISNSELTIKGPAAGLIVIVLGAVNEFKGMGLSDFEAYRMMLAVGVAAGVIQIFFGLFKAGVLGDFFPASAVHGLLASIGIIIISKQAHAALGVMDAKGGPLKLLSLIPDSISRMNPQIAVIGLASLVILIGMPLIKNRVVKKIPAQLVVIVVAIALGMFFNLQTEHQYALWGKTHRINEDLLVRVPARFTDAIATPNLDALKHGAAWKWVLMFALIGSLESLLSAKAVDTLDPLKRKTNFDRDLLAIGVANTLAAAVGGLPMISEIVRSKANIDNGAQTRLSGAMHGLFLLVFFALAPQLIHKIPLAALAAMLCFTGFRLASPKEFIHTATIGKEQLFVFVATIVGVLATDLLIGMAIGVVCEMAVLLYYGVSAGTLFKVPVDVETSAEGPTFIQVRDSAVFSNWIPLRSKIMMYGAERDRNVVVDLTNARMVDHTVMDKLHSLQKEFEEGGLRLEVKGLHEHRPVSSHPLAARRK